MLKVYVVIIFYLRDDDVWSGEEHSDRGDNGKKCKKDQADAVDDHSGKLPIVVDELILVIVPDLVGDDTQFLQDAGQFTVRTETVVQRQRLVLACFRWRQIIVTMSLVLI